MKSNILIVGAGLALHAAIRASKEIKDAHVVIVSHEMGEEEVKRRVDQFAPEPIKITARPEMKEMTYLRHSNEINEPIGAITKKGRKGKRRW